VHSFRLSEGATATPLAPDSFGQTTRFSPVLSASSFLGAGPSCSRIAPSAENCTSRSQGRPLVISRTSPHCQSREYDARVVGSKRHPMPRLGHLLNSTFARSCLRQSSIDAAVRDWGQTHDRARLRRQCRDFVMQAIVPIGLSASRHDVQVLPASGGFCKCRSGGHVASGLASPEPTLITFGIRRATGRLIRGMMWTVHRRCVST